ncbi:hypothetical protein Cyrtocomes_00916 [Candidatus Cyrtobacter comes]|uniref:Uncharacterized protein n=1 Tax=Candidatus Cyrtobacter comes TaxID=675776 RepID=A0ABU5L8T6_9RICK|nr:hypothetical protein [Candidatus Cyrtobacter comes]MDZ5762529.1 hypothetical protein [Candidatus Cyrtobacter comes]
MGREADTVLVMHNIDKTNCDVMTKNDLIHINNDAAAIHRAVFMLDWYAMGPDKLEEIAKLLFKYESIAQYALSTIEFHDIFNQLSIENREAFRNTFNKLRLIEDDLLKLIDSNNEIFRRINGLFECGAAVRDLMRELGDDKPYSDNAIKNFVLAIKKACQDGVIINYTPLKNALDTLRPITEEGEDAMANFLMLDTKAHTVYLNHVINNAEAMCRAVFMLDWSAIGLGKFKEIAEWLSTYESIARCALLTIENREEFNEALNQLNLMQDDLLGLRSQNQEIFSKIDGLFACGAVVRDLVTEFTNDGASYNELTIQRFVSVFQKAYSDGLVAKHSLYQVLGSLPYQVDIQKIVEVIVGDSDDFSSDIDSNSEDSNSQADDLGDEAGSIFYAEVAGGQEFMLLQEQPRLLQYHQPEALLTKVLPNNGKDAILYWRR